MVHASRPPETYVVRALETGEMDIVGELTATAAAGGVRVTARYWPTHLMSADIGAFWAFVESCL